MVFCFVDCNETITPQSRLQNAILNDSALDVKNAIEAGAKINFEQSSQAPLLKAVLLKKSKAANALLEAGANPNIFYAGEKLVFYIIKQGDLRVAEAFIKSKADFTGIIDGEQDAFTYVSTHFDTPISGKANRPDCDLLYAMINQGYDLKKNIENRSLSNNAWYLAIKNGDVNRIGFFLNWGGQVKKNLYELPVIADVNQVFTYKDESTWTPLLVAVKYYGEHEQKSHVGHGSALLTLVHYGNPDLNKKGKPLLDKPEQNAISFFLVLYNSINTRPEIIFEALLAHGADLTEGFKAYIRSGGNPNAIIKNGNLMSQKFTVSLLWLAINYKDIEAVKFLLSANADVNLAIEPLQILPHKNSRDAENKLRGPHTPLYFAMQQDDTAIADLLIECGGRI